MYFGGTSLLVGLEAHSSGLIHMGNIVWRHFLACGPRGRRFSGAGSTSLLCQYSMYGPQTHAITNTYIGVACCVSYSSILPCYSTFCRYLLEEIVYACVPTEEDI